MDNKITNPTPDPEGGPGDATPRGQDAVPPMHEAASFGDAAAAFERLRADAQASRMPPDPDAPTRRLPPAPAFPLDIFPAGLADDIREQHRTLNYPVDFSALAALTVTGFAVGPGARLRIRRGFEVTAVIFGVVVGKPGTGKTHPLNAYVRPLREFDRAARDAHADRKAEFEQAKAEAGKRGDCPLDDPGDAPVLVVTDTTIQALGVTLSRNPGGVLVHADELRQWLTSLTQYTRGGGGDTPHWLSLWNGQPLSVQRITRDNLYLANPYVVVLGGIQPAVLADLNADGRGNTGFLGRLLIADPDRLRVKPLPDDDIAPAVAERWSRCLGRVFGNREADVYDPQNPLTLTREARAVHAEWDRAMAKRIEELDGDGDEGLREQVAKFPQHLPRLALALELLHWGWGRSTAPPRTVGEDAMRGAIRAADYFMATARKVDARLTLAATRGSVAQLPELQRRILDALPDAPATFTTAEYNDVVAECGGNVKTAERWLWNWDRRGAPVVRERKGVYRKTAS